MRMIIRVILISSAINLFIWMNGPLIKKIEAYSSRAIESFNKGRVDALEKSRESEQELPLFLPVSVRGGYEHVEIAKEETSEQSSTNSPSRQEDYQNLWKVLALYVLMFLGIVLGILLIIHAPPGDTWSL